MSSTPTLPVPRPWRAWAILSGLYLAVTLLCRARFMGDTVDYVAEVLVFDRQGWEFGHLWWVPLGWAVQASLGLQSKAGIVWVFLTINWLSGLASLLLSYGFLVRAGITPRRAGSVAVAFLFTQAFLNFTLTGSSYVPGLACLLLASFLALDDHALVSSVAAGLALAASICFWFPYVLAVPGVLAAPLLLRGFDRVQCRRVVGIGLALGLGVGAAYLVAVLSLGITDVAGFRAWMARSTHGVSTRGLTRMVFGLARSFVHLGDDGLLFKRHLLGDPYNPVSLTDLVRLSLSKFLFFYLALCAIGLNLLTGPRLARRILVLALVGGMPVIVFGIFWQGGDMERYLPLYPLFFLALAASLSPESGWRFTRALPVAFFVLAGLVNAFSLSRWEVDRQHRLLADRIEELHDRLTPHCHVFVSRDRLHLLPRNFPLDARARGLVIVEVAVPGVATTPHWKAAFASLAFSTWNKGGQVWLSRRLFAPVPHPDGTWVEGDDPRLRWEEVPSFFRRLATAEEVGGDDGFVRVPETRSNRAILAGES